MTKPMEIFTRTWDLKIKTVEPPQRMIARRLSPFSSSKIEMSDRQVSLVCYDTCNRYLNEMIFLILNLKQNYNHTVIG